jgi:hypothetical protein
MTTLRFVLALVGGAIYLIVSLNVVRSLLVPRVDRSSLLRFVIRTLTVPGHIVRHKIQHYALCSLSSAEPSISSCR